jgi:hypothetical protein
MGGRGAARREDGGGVAGTESRPSEWWWPGGIGRGRAGGRQTKARAVKNRDAVGTRARVRVADAPLRGLREPVLPCRAVQSRYGRRNGARAGKLTGFAGAISRWLARMQFS